MKRLNKAALALATAGLLASGVAQAALNDRGGGLLYDDVLDVTWLQDANYAKTSGYDADGLMSWTAAKTWAGSLNISRFAGESLSGWRLAANTPVGANWNYNFSYDGSTDVGYNITSPHNELSYMYYVNLGLKGYYDTSGIYQPDFGVFRNGTVGGQADVGSVKNLRSGVYWSGTAFAPNPAVNAWFFFTSDGLQSFNHQGNELFAWAVRPGDVAAVPEPEAYAMLLAGLGLLGVVAKRRRRSFAAS
ncbi:MAG: PEP-CTERM sorting domain-containing protein [Sulfuritalea sp.]|nr:PEP-CTERM sorting domain-containing protein [Sulfuritalea sp.]